MDKRGIGAGKLFGILIYIDYSWLIIFILVSWLLSTGYYPSKYGFETSQSIVLGITTAALFFISALVHELLHSIVAIRNKIPVKRIILYLFGGLAELFEDPKNPDAEFKVAIAGPTASMVLALIFLLFWKTFENTQLEFFTALWATLFQVNLMLAIFNLLPGFPLDGGRILRSIIWASTNNFMTATKIATFSGKALSFFIVFFGIFLILISGFWGGLWLVLVGLFLNQAASQSLLELRIKHILTDKTAQDFKQSILFVNPKLSLSEAVSEYFSATNQEVFPVATKYKLLGLLYLDDIKRYQDKLTEFNRAEDVMRAAPDVFVKPNDPAIRVLKLMTMNRISFLPIKNKKGEIIGVVALDRIALYITDQKII